jgi:DNA-directed RNA polymerase III subunit RPC1
MMIRPNGNMNIHFSESIANKEYDSGYHLCRNDGCVSFLDSLILLGVLEKSLIGVGAKSLFAIFTRDISPAFSAILMSRIAKPACRFMMNRDFLTGIARVTPNDELREGKMRIIHTAYAKQDRLINDLKANRLQPFAGHILLSTFEKGSNNILLDILSEVGHLVSSSTLQAKYGGRDGEGLRCQHFVYDDLLRTVDDLRATRPGRFHRLDTPHFHHNTFEPVAKGPVANSFFSGLESYEFFFHTMAWRGGLVDASVKTAETGCLRRRLMKPLQDVVICYT